jgi:hypothetical protein
MELDAILEVLTFANSNEQSVRLTLRDGTEMIGVPSVVDTHPTAHEVYIAVGGDDDTEVGIAIEAIASAELI